MALLLSRYYLRLTAAGSSRVLPSKDNDEDKLDAPFLPHTTAISSLIQAGLRFLFLYNTCSFQNQKQQPHQPLLSLHELPIDQLFLAARLGDTLWFDWYWASIRLHHSSSSLVNIANALHITHKDSLLHAAVAGGNLDILSRILTTTAATAYEDQEEVDCSLTDKDSCTALHLAAAMGYTCCCSSLHLPCVSQSFEILKLLKQHSPRSFQKALGLSSFSSSSSSSTSHVSILHSLLMFSSNVTCPVSGHENTQVLSLLLQNDSAITTPSTLVAQIDCLGNTPLHYAARNGLEEHVKLLLLHYANPDLTNSQGLSAADLALAHGHENITSLISARTQSKRHNVHVVGAKSVVRKKDSGFWT